MAISIEDQTKLLKVVTGLFNATPGSVFLPDMETFIEDVGTHLELARGLASSEAFTVSLGEASTSEEIAAVLAGNFGLDSTTDAGAAAIAFFAEGLENSVSAGDLVHAAVEFLGQEDLAADFAETATLLTNKAAVAGAYSAVKGSDDFAILQSVLAGITGAALLTDEEIAAIVADADGDPIPGEEYVLTYDTDVATANIFTANLVFTPGGDDRINALQDEDILTGTGGNPTLNATVGNANDNGGTIITPSLQGIQILNASFTGSGGGAGAVTTLDMQDANGLMEVNVDRVSQGVNFAEIANIQDSTVDKLSVTNSNSNQAGTVEFSYTPGVLAGENAVALGVDNVQVAALNIGQNTSGVGAFPGGAGVGTQGYENIALSNSGANVVGTFNLPMDTGVDGSVSITGTGSLVLGASANIVNSANAALNEAVGVHTALTGIQQAGGRLANINASEFEGDLTLVLDNLLDVGKADTSGVAQDVTVTLGSGTNTIALYDAVQTGDSLIGGTGDDTLVFYSGSSLGSSAAGFEASSMLGDGSTGNISLDYDNLPDATGMTVRNISSAAGINAAEAPVTFTLYDMSAVQSTGLAIQHGTSFNNQITNTIVRAAVKTNTASDTVGVSIDEGINVDPRANFTVDTVYAAVGTTIPSSGTSTFENVTLTNNDSESNSIELNDFATHTGTLTIAKGEAAVGAGTFVNLDVDTAQGDVTVNTTGTAGGAENPNNGTQQGLFGIDTDGGTLGTFTAPATVATGGEVDLARTSWSTGNIVDLGLLATQVRLGTATIDASAVDADVIVRVSTNVASATGAQTITTGAGNDAVIFDQLNESHAGLTISDTVNAGDGTDTLLIDGHGVRVDLGASEWTNVSNFEAIRLVGNQSAPISTTSGNNSYNLTLTNDLINANGGDMLNIVNDNDQNNDADVFLDATAVNTVTTAANAESGVTIDATGLNSANHFTYNGEEGTSRTADRFIFNDDNVNGVNVIDGGAVTNNSGSTTAALAAANTVANADTFEVRDGGNVTIGDLENISNVGTFILNNETGAEQTTKLWIDDATVDRLVNSYHTAVIDTLGNQETLTINANDGTVVGATGPSRVELDASGVTGRTAFIFTDDAALGANDIVTVAANVSGAVNSITLAAANATVEAPVDIIDTVKVTGSSTTLSYTAGVNAAGAVANALGTITYTTGAASKTDVISGAAANAVGLDVTEFTGTAALIGSGLNDVFTIDSTGLAASTITGNGNTGVGDTVVVSEAVGNITTATLTAATLALDTDGAGAGAAVTHTLAGIENVNLSSVNGAITLIGATATMSGASAAASALITVDGTSTLNIVTSNYTPSDAALFVIAGGTVAAGTAGLTIDLSNQTEAINITGSTGGSTLIGGAAADTITGGAGVDTSTGNAGADVFTYATGDTGITLATADVITDFVTASDSIATSLVAGNATIADGSALADFTAFVAAADAVLTAGAGVDDSYIAYNAAASGNAWVVIDEDDSGSVDAGDTVIVLNGIDLVTEIVVGDIA